MSDTPRTMGNPCEKHTTVHADGYCPICLIEQLAAYQQAEMPEEPKWLKDFDRGLLVTDSADRDLIIYADALRVHLARVTVERNEAKAHNEKMSKLATPAEFTLAENRRLREQLAAAKEAQEQEKELHECDVKMWQEDVHNANLRAESAERKLAECEKEKK